MDIFVKGRRIRGDGRTSLQERAKDKKILTEVSLVTPLEQGAVQLPVKGA